MKIRGNNVFGNVTAVSIVASLFGVLAGIGGFVHGIGEVLQGNVKPDGIWIDSWTQGPIATNMDGEPGMTIIPNLLVTGILTLLVSSSIVIWAIFFIKREKGGRTLILLSIIMLLVGGGVGPPVMGILAGICGLGNNSLFGRCVKHRSINVQRLLAIIWPWIFIVAVINGIFLVIGSLVLVYIFNVNNPGLFSNSFLFTMLFLILLIFAGPAYDIQKNRGV